MIEEVLQAKIVQILSKRLPDTLAQASAVPFVYTRRSKEGQFSSVSECHTLQAPQEIQSAEGKQLYFPSVIVGYSGSAYREVSDEGSCKYAGDVSFTIDLALIDGDEQLLTYLWMRYAAAIKDVLREADDATWYAQVDGVDYVAEFSVTGQAITSLTTDGQAFARRGAIEIQLSF